MFGSCLQQPCRIRAREYFMRERKVTPYNTARLSYALQINKKINTPFLIIHYTPEKQHGSADINNIPTRRRRIPTKRLQSINNNPRSIELNFKVHPRELVRYSGK